MQRFPVHTTDTARGAAASRLEALEQRHRHVGTMVATMAGSPSVLPGYLDLSRSMRRTQLPPPVSERISLAVQATLRCELCLQSHADAARSVGVSEDEIALAKQGTSSDPAIAPVVAFGRRAHLDPASITDADIATLRAVGLRDRDVLDIVGLVALNVLTGTFNLVAGLEAVPVTPGVSHRNPNEPPKEQP